VLRSGDGKTKEMHCKFHGWRYDLRGQLLKAPGKDGIDGVTREEFSLFKVRLRVSGSGHVFVNLCREEAVSHEAGQMDRVLDKFSFAEHEFRYGFAFEGEFNWKRALERYQRRIGIV
jgi:phenylpropionate dioxygenase-like ring-hydroxylating dioxygenase large terminal subunit